MIDDDVLKIVEDFNLLMTKVSDLTLQAAIVDCCKQLLTVQGLLSMSEGIRLNLDKRAAGSILGTIEKTLKEEFLD